MKNFFVTVLLVVISASAMAQGPKNLDSLLYVFPQFENGVVTYNNGDRSRGDININLIDQTVRVLGRDGEILIADDNSNIKSVTAGKRIFYSGRDGWIEILSFADEACFGVIRKTVLVNNAQVGAYGAVTATASINNLSYNDYANSNLLNNSILDIPENHTYKETPCLYRRGTQMVSSKKSFIKCFPNQKAFIEEFLDKNPVNFNKLDEARTFFLLLKGKQGLN